MAIIAYDGTEIFGSTAPFLSQDGCPVFQIPGSSLGLIIDGNVAFGFPTGNQWQIFVSKNSGAYQQVLTNSTFGVKSADASSDADETKILIPQLS